MLCRMEPAVETEKNNDHLQPLEVVSMERNSAGKVNVERVVFMQEAPSNMLKS